MTYIPTRLCIVCRSRLPQDKLIRVKKSGNEIGLKVSTGRSAYICKNSECISNCIKSHSLDRAFRCKVDPKVYDSLEKILHE